MLPSPQSQSYLLMHFLMRISVIIIVLELWEFSDIKRLDENKQYAHRDAIGI